ncbi:MAG: T9SS type A sorting domain-containing protein [Bacteroidetes bacterium]|nr:T9SS type A sorting domain-containing protein [Bacteroidota bacterium]
MYRSLLRLMILLVLPTVAFGQQPVGWASLNGGTTGGEGGPVVTATTRSELLTYISSDNPYVIRVQDTIELNLYEMVEVGSNTTLEGLGTNAVIRYGGLELQGENIIVRNLEIYDSYDGDWGGTSHSTDAITVYGATNVWIDHCWVHTSADGILDIRSDGPGNLSDYVTVSNTRFSDHNKVMLIGASNNDTWDAGHLKVTLYKCWFDGTIDKGLNQRMPRARYGDIHILNSYYEDIDFYCAAARIESDLVIENCWYRNCITPHEIEDVGLGSEDPDIVAIGNIYEFATGDQQTNGDAFTPSDFYSYTPLDNLDVPGMVMNDAGPMNPDNNIAPVAVDETVQLNNLTAPVFIEAVDNDTDADNGDLRIAVVLNEVQGNPLIQQNLIIYYPTTDMSGPDSLYYQLVDTDGGVDTGLVVVNPPASATQDLFEAGVEMKISPNPVQGITQVELTSPFDEDPQFKLYDIYGREYSQLLSAVQHAGSAYTLEFQASNLSPGTYFLQVIQGNRMSSQKILKTE